MDKNKFKQLAAQGHNRIPMYRCISADLDTPLSAWLKLANGKHTFLLESVEGGARWGRYSIIGLSANFRFQVSGQRFKEFAYDTLVDEYEVEDVLEQVEAIKARYSVPVISELPAFNGGLVGYFGYEIIEQIEDKLTGLAPEDQLQIPDIQMMLAEDVAVFDNLAGKVWLITHVNPDQELAYEKGSKRLRDLIHRLRSGTTGYAEMINQNSINTTDFKTGFTQTEFNQAIDQCKTYIESGDIMQVVLSQRISTQFNARPLDVYRALRASNPSPYMYFMDFDDYQVVGSSPEVLVKREANEVTLRPIAGTRPRGKTAEEDQALEVDLLSDPKEIAEHLMLIDLGRNDLGRIAEIGSVELKDKMVIEHYSHVMHIVSEIKAKIKTGQSNADIIKAVFPAGTLSGAAKVRAMEVIAELEKVKRNVYAGAVGYWGWHGDMDMAIAIRTAVIKDQELHVQAGAGIVADSTAEGEWNEIMNKAGAVFKAVELATKGL